MSNNRYPLTELYIFKMYDRASYRQAFGEDPPMINGVAIMTDTDNTRERAVAYYGDIRFERVAP